MTERCGISMTNICLEIAPCGSDCSCTIYTGSCGKSLRRRRMEQRWSEKTKTDVAVDFRETKSTNIYLPAGTLWYDFWTNEKHEGGKEITKETTLDVIPLYVKRVVLFLSVHKFSMQLKNRGVILN